MVIYLDRTIANGSTKMTTQMINDQQQVTKLDSSFDRLCALLETYVSERKELVTEKIVEIPLFYGDDDDLRPWLDWMENRFASEDFTDDQKMAMACGFLDGKAASWYHEQISRIPFQSWEDLKSELLLRFGNVDDPELITFHWKWKLQWPNMAAYPIFSGEDVKLWVYMIERLFLVDNLWNWEKLELAHSLVEGEAKEFVQRKESFMPFCSWNQMRDELLLSFGRDDDPDIIHLRIETERSLKEFMVLMNQRYSASLDTETNDSRATKQSEETVDVEELQKMGEDDEELQKMGEDDEGCGRLLWS